MSFLLQIKSFIFLFNLQNVIKSTRSNSIAIENKTSLGKFSILSSFIFF